MYSLTTFEAFNITFVFQFQPLGKGHLTNKGEILRTILPLQFLYDSPGAVGYMVKAKTPYIICIVWVLKMSVSDHERQSTHAFRQCCFFFFFF